MCLPNAKQVHKVEREWEHAGLLCAVVQAHKGGSRCGYVRVPPGHPMHGKDCDDVDVQVHGGLTFSEEEPCAHEDGIGHWFGFDCAHFGDQLYEPGNEPDFELELRKRWAIEHPEWEHLHDNDHWWTHDEVVAETEQLAEQLAAMTVVAP